MVHVRCDTSNQIQLEILLIMPKYLVIKKIVPIPERAFKSQLRARTCEEAG